jgi:hypothetical protein
MGLCRGHISAYRRAGRPGGAVLPVKWEAHFEGRGLPVPVECSDQAVFESWCATAGALYLPGHINLLGLGPLVQAELRWGLFAHMRQPDPGAWPLPVLHLMINMLRSLDCIADLDPDSCPQLVRMVARQLRDHLRPVYYSPAASKDAGFADHAHFGFRFRGRRGYFDLTPISQRWLRDVLWDVMADRMRSPQAPRRPHPTIRYGTRPAS